MKQLHNVLAILLCAWLLQGFKPIPTTSNSNSNTSKYNYSRFMHSLWLNPSQASAAKLAPRINYSVTLTISNYWQPNVIINWVGLGDENNHGSWHPPIQPGDNQSITYTDGNAYGPVYVSITLAGPTEDPTAIRTLYLLDTNGYHCQEITGDGVYIFYNLFFGNLYGNIIADTGGCW